MQGDCWKISYLVTAESALFIEKQQKIPNIQDLETINSAHIFFLRTTDPIQEAQDLMKENGLIAGNTTLVAENTESGIMVEFAKNKQMNIMQVNNIYKLYPHLAGQGVI